MVTKLTLAYDGAAFAGWARQPEQRTVQAELERALRTILGEDVATTAAGRTDTGVHAWGGVRAPPQGPLDRRPLTALLPEAAAGPAGEPMDESFDARHSASS